MTKLNLKELRELHAKGMATTELWTSERSIFHAQLFAEIPALLDWIERASVMIDSHTNEPCVCHLFEPEKCYRCRSIEMLAELEEA